LRHIQIAGTPLELYILLHIRKLYVGTQLIAGSNSKKYKDWAIRSQAPKLINSINKHGEGSETRCLWVKKISNL